MIQTKVFAILQPIGSGDSQGAQLFPAHRFAAAAAKALSLIAGVSLVSLFSAANSQAQTLRGSCDDAAELAVLPSPLAPWKGAPLRVMFAAEKPLEGELSLIGARRQGRRQVDAALRRTALLLDRRSGAAGRGQVAGEARALERAGRVQHDHAHDHRAGRQAGSASRSHRAASGRCATNGTARPRTCIRRGSRSCSTRRSTPRCRGRRCMSGCAISRATSCTIIWVSTKTR